MAFNSHFIQYTESGIPSSANIRPKINNSIPTYRTKYLPVSITSSRAHLSWFRPHNSTTANRSDISRRSRKTSGEITAKSFKNSLAGAKVFRKARAFFSEPRHLRRNIALLYSKRSPNPSSQISNDLFGITGWEFLVWLELSGMLSI